MPELPEVETVRRGLAPVMEGARIAAAHLARADLRFPFPEGFAARLTGRCIVALGRRAKYLQADLDSGEVLVMHLGMSGSFRIETSGDGADPLGDFHHARSKAAAHDHVTFALSSGARVVYNDPRRFGFMLLVPRAQIDVHPLFAGLGPEPLGNAFDAAHLARAAAGRRTSVKALLLDQHVIAGVGNIYASETLFRAGVSPRRMAASLATRAGAPTAAAARLAQALRDVLTEAIAAGGASIADHSAPNGDLGSFQHAFRVYDRAGAPCARPGCHGTIGRIVQCGRASFHCPACQR